VKLFLGILCVAGLLIVGCSSQEKSGSGGDVQGSFFKADADASGLADAGVVIAGIEFHPPSAWTDLGPSGMRQAQYTYGPCEGHPDSATMTVYYFGPDQGGGVRANIDRWIGQIKQPEGTDPAEAVIEQQVTVDGMPVHVVEVTGTYGASGMGMGPNEDKEGYRMAAVVLEGPEGNVFFKLTGPDKCAGEMTGQFAAMVMNIKKAG
jgi:hypothetical protein